MLRQTIPRKKPAKPISWLIENNLINGNGDILHYGRGKDIPGTHALAKIGTVTEYDPNILEINKIPSQQYDSLVSCFVLNCAHHKTREHILFNISNTVTKNGSAFIAVRSIKDSDYKIKQTKWWPISDGFTNGKLFQKFYTPEDLILELKRHFKTAFILYDKGHAIIAQASHNTLPKKSVRFGTGKQMVNCVYIHKSSEQILPGIEIVKKYLPEKYEYAVVKFHWINNTFSFIQSLDFDSAYEPTVGDSLIVYADGKTKLTKAPKDSWIYHHKWLMVSDTYSGFNVSQAKSRSLAWMKFNPDRSKIGKKSSWLKNILPRL